MSVAVRRPFRAPFVRPRARFGRYLSLHDKVRQQLRHGPQGVLSAARRLNELACELVRSILSLAIRLLAPYVKVRNTSTGASSGWPVKTQFTPSILRGREPPHHLDCDGATHQYRVA